MISAEARRVIGQFPLGVVATVTAEGRPAASPKGTFLVLDDRTLGYGDIRSPGTRANLERVRGRARLVGRDKREFEALWPRWQAVWGDLADRIGALVLFDVTDCKPVVTPPYDDGVTEDEMIALYKTKYAEIYP